MNLRASAIFLPVLFPLVAVTSACARNASSLPPASTQDAGATARPSTEPKSAAPDPTRWRSTAKMKVGRHSHSATLLSDGRVLVVGGEDESQTMLKSTEIFDPAAESWSPGPALPKPRSNHAAVSLEDGRVLIIGGGKNTPTGQPSGEAVIGDALLFDPATNAFESAGELADPRSHLQAVRLTSGKVLVTGGGSSEQDSPDDCKNAPYCGPFGVALASAEIFDPSNGSWTQTGAMRETRASFVLVALADGRAMANGGVNAKAEGRRSSEIFDPETGTWSDMPEMKTPREHHVATLLASGKVFVVAGKNPNVTPLATTQVFDPAAKTWSEGPFLSEPMTMPSLTTLSSGRTFVIGGYAQLKQLRGGSGYIRETAIFQEDANELASLGELKEGRVMATATTLVDGKVLVAGGLGDNGALATCEIAE